MNKKKRIMLTIVALLITVGMVVGVSYALWQVTLQQSSSNVITTGCFKVEFTDKNPIHLERTYPITDEEGSKTTPYEFTITNTCDNDASYQINLEVLNSSTLTNIEYIREQLNEKGSISGSRILNTNDVVEKTLNEAKESYKLKEGVLKGQESKTYEFRLWLDESTPAVSEVMNKTLNSKITITTSLKPPVDTRNMMIAMDLEEVCGFLCRITKNNTYTQGEKYSTTLKKIIFESEKTPIEGAIEEVDFSVNQDGSVVGYYVENESQEVTLHIQADGKIKMNENGSYYFAKYDFQQESTYIFEGLESFDTSEVTNMSHMFQGMMNIESLNLSNFNTRNVTNMSYMFAWMDNLTSLDVSNFNTSNVTNMTYMFNGLNNLMSLDVSHFDTRNVTDMSYMFNGLNNLTNLDVSNFNTSNVTDMREMFNGLNNLTSLDLSNFNTRNVTDMSYMFSGISNLTNLNLSSFNTSKVTTMDEMFSNSQNLTNIIYGDNFIKHPELGRIDMYLNCPANKPTHSSWDGVSW